MSACLSEATKQAAWSGKFTDWHQREDSFHCSSRAELSAVNWR